MADVEILPSIIPERRQRPTPEIIDVDLLDDCDVRPSQRRRLSAEAPSTATRLLQPIIIIDSDDEDGHSATSGRTHQQTHSVPDPAPRTRRLPFSPPPPPRDSDVPPLPHLPRHLAGLSSLPMRRRPPPFPAPAPGVVRPNENPFPFEANIREVERRGGRNSSAQVPPPAAAPSHHQPLMGFGGALLAFNRQNTVQDIQTQRGRERHHQRGPRTFGMDVFHEATGYLADVIRRVAGSGSRHQSPPHYVIFGDPIFDLHGNDDLFEDFPVWDGRRGTRRSGPDFKPSFTHPGKPAPGFAFDFAPPSSSPSPAPSTSKSVIVLDNTPGPSNAGNSASTSEEAHTVLVCARCLDPLVLGGLDTEEGRDKHRLWGLRCGHLLDGKCMEEIMKPAQPVVVSHVDVVDVKGKGNSMGGTPPASVVEIDILQVGERGRMDKGKGKAVEPEHSELPEVDSIRSRLRPRHHPSDSRHTAPQSVDPAPRRPLPVRRGAGARTKVKGKGKAREPIVEAEHEWFCPVAGCGKAHTSLYMDGKWIMDSKKGAITMFV